MRSSAGLTTSVAWQAAGQTQYCVDGQVYTVASAVRWLQDLGLLHSATDLDALVAKDSEGVMCVPAFAGLAAPWWASEATASLTGLTLATRREHLILAVLQGIAAQVTELTALVGRDLDQPLNRLRADGGLTNSAALMQAQADIAQLPVDIYPNAHATPSAPPRSPAAPSTPPSASKRPSVTGSQRPSTNPAGPRTGPRSSAPHGHRPPRRVPPRRPLMTPTPTVLTPKSSTSR